MKKIHCIAAGLFLLFLQNSFSQGIWSVRSKFAMQRCLMASFAIGNYGYIGTGNTPTSGSYSDLWRYDPITDSWTQMANMPGVIRRRPVGFSVNGKGYFGLGIDGTVFAFLNDLWEYDPVANAWVQKANFPSTGRFGAMAFSVGSKGYVGLGTDVAGGYYNDLWEYDPATNAWTAKANFAGGKRGGAVAFTVGSRAYVGMGVDSLQYWNDFWEYNPASNSWLKRTNYPGPPSSYGVGITIFNRGYVGTGADGVNFYDDWYEFNPVANAWNVMTSFAGSGRFHMIGFGINCRGYIGTGHYGFSTSLWFDDWYEFIPPAYQFASISSNGGNAICAGSSATLVASGGSSYVWSTGATSSSIVVSPTSATTYTVTASTGGALGCTSTATVTITIKTINIYTTAYAINCGSTNGAVSVNVGVGGTAPYSYLWTPGNQTTQMATGLNATGNYTVTVTDAGGCSATTSVTVVAINAPYALINGNKTICMGDPTTLTVSGGNSYSWSTGSTSTAIVVSPSAATTYSVIAAIGSCKDTQSVTVAVFPPPVISTSGNITICSGNAATLAASGASVPPYSYSWNTGAATTSISVAPTSTTTYSVVASLGTCKDTGIITVSAIPLPIINPTGNTILCKGDITTLSASGGISYSWSNGVTQPFIVVSPPVTTTYSVIVGNGICAKDTFLTVNVFPAPIAAISGSHDICAGSSAQLTASGGGTYLWNTGETTAVIRPSTPGNYSVIVAIGSCLDSASLNLTVHPLPTANVSPNVTIVQGQTAYLSATGGVNYIWNNNFSGQYVSASPQSTTNYCVTVVDANNCTDMACTEVFVLSCETAGTLFLPNAFSPNGDGENDSLQIFFGLFDCIQSFKLSIYNRWGEKIFQTNDPYFHWGGIYNKGLLKGTEYPASEVFVYYMEAALGDGSKIARKGNITLFR